MDDTSWVTGYAAAGVMVGTVATAVMDLSSAALKRFGGVASPNYAMVGRWIAYMPQGRFRHASIAAAPARRGERPIGWIVHYLTGTAFASLLFAIWGLDWLQRPTVGPALLVGFGTVLAPFFVMQPAMGAGIAASRTPDPGAARARSLVNHGLFGLGLYAAGWITHLLRLL